MYSFLYSSSSQSYKSTSLRYLANLPICLITSYSLSFFNEFLIKELEYLNMFYANDLKNFLNEMILSTN